MTIERQFFEKGISLQTYMEQMTEKKEESEKIYQTFQLPKATHYYEAFRPKSQNVLVITEDWCGDAMMNNAILRHLGEVYDLDIRIAYRDADTTLIDRHLTNGGRSIPIYLLLDDEGEVLGKWGPRAQMIQRDVTKMMSNLPDKEASNFEQKRSEVIQHLTTQYKENRDYWLAVHDELVMWLTKG